MPPQTRISRPGRAHRRVRTKLRAAPAVAALVVGALVGSALAPGPGRLAAEELPDELTSAPDDALAGVRAEFTAALQRVRAGADTGPTTDSMQLREYPLYRYLEAARIGQALAATSGSRESAADVAARAFLARYGDEPVTRSVRRALLDSLARRERWSEFLADADRETSDTSVRCLIFQARIALGEHDGLADEIAQTWLTGQRLPSDCEPAFEWLRAEGRMTDELIEARVRLLLENGQPGFARVIAGRLPAERARPWQLWADLIERPRETLDRLLADPAATVPDGALADGWARLTRNRPGDALEQFPALVERFRLDASEASRAALALALGLAWDRRPEALEYFARVAPADLDDYALGWVARAALWAGDFRLAGDAILAMSPEQQSETRWRYWAARAAEQRGEHRRARELYRSVVPTDNYYAAMAAARLGEPMTPRQTDVPVDTRRLERLAALAPFVRARELLRVRTPAEAAAEWRYGSSEIDAADRLQTIHLGMSWGWYDVAVATATSQSVFDDYRLLYPTPYDEPVRAAAALTGIDPALLYGVIRQESLYRADAASAAGAFGLAQLRLETAQRVARRLGRPPPSRADLLVPEINVILGAAELRSLLDQFDGQLPLALAAYNAGPNAARRWRPNRPLDADIWIENVPFNETRDYVQRVLWHSLVFAWLDSGEGRDTREWLSAIRPAADAQELHAER